MQRRVKASAPAKVILFGEHFVVYDKPAIVFAIDKRATVTAEIRTDKKIWITSKNMEISGYFLNGQFYVKKGDENAEKKLEPIHAIFKKLSDLSGKNVGVNIEINSSFPVAVGLGSSAAVAVASTAALSHLLEIDLTKDEIFKISLEAEGIVHRNPSGIDPAISTYGGVLLYRKDRDIKPLDVKTDLPLVIGDTEIKRSTGEIVARVGDLIRRYPFIANNIIKAGGEIVTRGIEALKDGDLKTLGELMNINHALLYAMGASNQHLENLVYAARKAGALGAKLTGGGGGGCMIALVVPGKFEDIAMAIEQAGGKAYITRKTAEGVRFEE
ncbi:MAG: mevalonate kinase [Candidatus Bathyarchaeia archaeon]